MKTTKFITGLFLCGSILAACNSDEDHGKEALISKPAEVEISIVTPSTYALTGGEEPGSADENKVTSIEIYVFNADGTIDTKTGATGNGYFSATVPTATTTFSYTVIMDSGNQKKFVAVANMGLGALASGEDYDDLKAKLSTAAFTASAAAGYNSRTIPANGFEMSGETVAKIEPGPINSVRIPISRLVSKINAPNFFYLDPADGTTKIYTGVVFTPDQVKELWGDDAGDVGTIAFRSVGYALVNGITKSSALFNGRLSDNDDTAPRTKPWGDWTWDGKSYLNSTFDTDGKYTGAYSGQSNSGDWFLATDGSVAGEEYVYVYENKPEMTTVNDQTGLDPKKVYAFIVKGELVVDGDTNNSNDLNLVRYWRVDLARDDAYHILRNNLYSVYIKTIKSIGFPTEQEAEDDPDIIPPNPEDTSAKIEIEVNKWRVNQTITDI
jgi:hypothetical protein